MSEKQKRILIVDDNPSIHEDLKHILSGYNVSVKTDSEKENMENELFDTVVEEPHPEPSSFDIQYRIDDAYQGEEAILLVEKAEEEGDPYALIFMDVRMPPGMDGITTIKKIWENNPHVQIVICTAYSDYSWDGIIQSLGITDNLLFLRKPFDNVSMKQIAVTLTTRWGKDKEYRKNMKKIEQMDMEAKQIGFYDSSEHSMDGEHKCSTVAGHKIFNKNSLMKRLGKNRTLAAIMLQTFIEDTPNVIERIREALAAGNAAGVMRTAHVLKGSASNVGADLLEEISRNVEMQANEDKLQNIPFLLNEITQELRRFKMMVSGIIT